MTVLDAYPWICQRFADVREEAGGRASADCPIKCHRNARMNFAVGGNGQLLLRCWAGCDRLEALRAVGCSWKDCFPGERIPDKVPRTETYYPYCDATGQMRYQAVRLEPGFGGKDKTFYRRRPSPDGWVKNLEGVELILYRLPELLEAPKDKPVFVVAGEKDADNLRAVGFVATTNIGGESATWHDSYSQTLALRDCLVVEDRDSAGKRHACEVRGSLMDYARSIRRVTFPAKDATAFLVQLRMCGISDVEEIHEYVMGAVAESRRWVCGCVEQGR